MYKALAFGGCTSARTRTNPIEHIVSPSCDVLGLEEFVKLVESADLDLVYYCPCEQWLPGTYNVTIIICNGQCGSQHSHTQIYDTAFGSFQISEE